MDDIIRVAILEDHPAIIDGYRSRLSTCEDITIIGELYYGEALEPFLAQHPVDILLLDVSLPTSPTNPNPYPLLYILPRLIQAYPSLSILIISMYAPPSLVQAVMDAGANGYILKDDHESNRELASIVRIVYKGGIHISQSLYHQLLKRPASQLNQPLSQRQLEALSLCAAYPDASTVDLARSLKIAHSTFRNLLSQAYLKLNVRTRAAAIERARQMGVISPNPSLPSLDIYDREDIEY